MNSGDERTEHQRRVVQLPRTAAGNYKIRDDTHISTERDQLDQPKFHAQFEKFEEKFHNLTAALELVERRSQQLAQRLSASEAKTKAYTDKFQQAQEQNIKCQEREQFLSQELARVGVLLESQASEACFMEQHLQQLLNEEHARSERLRDQREHAFIQRDEAIAELAAAYADIDAMQATLADSAVYVRHMRRRMQELEEQRQGSCARQARAQTPDEEGGDIFSLASIRTSIEAAVKEAMQHDEAEQKRRIRQLQLRWHPDKNPVLKEFATEVSKLINKAVKELEENQEI